MVSRRCTALVPLALVLLGGCSSPLGAVAPGMPRAGCVALAAPREARHGTWSEVAPTTAPRYFLAATTGCDGRIYVLGGLGPPNGDPGGVANTALVEAFDPAAHGWTVIAPMPTPRDDLAAATGPDGRIFAIGGETGGQMAPTTVVEAYSPRQRTWSAVAPLPVALDSPRATTGTDGHIYVLGTEPGAGGGPATEVYDPAANTWTNAPPMPSQRWRFVVVTAPDGRVVVAGGYDTSSNSGPVATVEAYSPTTGRWTSLAAMPTPLGQSAGAVAADGRLYMLGGDSSWNESQVNTVEVYDFATDRWTGGVAPMPIGRNCHAAALGPDGRIYVVGGDDGYREQNGTAFAWDANERRVDVLTP